VHYFIPLAYDRIDSVKGTGKGTMARCDALVKEARKVVERTFTHHSCVFISTAGYTKASPDKPTPEIPWSLAEQMMKHISGSGFCKRVARPVAWGTYQELALALDTLLERYRDSDKWSFDIYISTNAGHMPRVKMCCWFLKRQRSALLDYNPQFHFISASHSFTPKEWVQETIKLFLYLYRFLFKKW